MRLPRLSLPAFRRLTLAAALSLAAIVVTGGAVRLTGSGLGCTTWPQCDKGALVPPLGVHPWIEFGNRLVTVVVTVVVVVTAVAAMLLRERRRDLRRLAWGLVLGVAAQAVVGGLSVIYDLLPGWVMAHFLLSMLVLWDAVVLHHRAAPGWRAARPAVRPEVVWLGRLLVATAGVVLVLGTVVTGTGPHAGDPTVTTRLPFRLEAVTQLHADIALFLTGLVVATVLALRVADAPGHVRRRSLWVVGAILVQAAIGYTQWLTGLPVGLVGAHIAGATLLWVTTLWLNLGFTSPAPLPVPEQPEQSARHAAPALATER